MKWNVYGLVTGSKYMGEVEAATKEEAQEKADKLDSFVGLCWQCSNQVDSAEVQEIIVEEAE